MSTTHDIYDRIAKRCLSLSPKTTVNLINGLYHTNYPLDSEISYNWTENNDDELHRTLADTIITINGQDSYHMEFQMTNDGDIIFRVFEYGFHHAIHSRSNINQLYFPEPMVIYLYDRESFPDEYEMEIFFGNSEPILYKVPVFKYLKTPMSELEERNLIAFIPFQLLRFRRAIEKERSPENISALKNLITHDILNSINHNLHTRNITQSEAIKLGRMVMFLYHHIYDKYDELEKEGIGQMADEALIFDIDILEHEIKQLKEQQESLIKDKDSITKDRDSIAKDRDSIAKDRDSIAKDRDSIAKDRDSIAKSNVMLLNQNKNLELQISILRLLSQGYTPEQTASQLQISLELVTSVKDNRPL